tara:strand:+ start:362 stop:577 length:216 start_codon:yes stop_codon:yes gene_type:complete
MKANKVKFEVGDLVQFEYGWVPGLVTETKISEAFEPDEKLLDVKVNWADGIEFWCLEFTLKLLAKNNIINN